MCEDFSLDSDSLTCSKSIDWQNDDLPKDRVRRLIDRVRQTQSGEQTQKSAK